MNEDKALGISTAFLIQYFLFRHHFQDTRRHVYLISLNLAPDHCLRVILVSLFFLSPPCCLVIT